MPAYYRDANGRIRPINETEEGPREEDTSPLGEDAPQDTAPPKPAPDKRDPDVYALSGVSPALVKEFKPRWSIARCRRWLVRYENTLYDRIQSDTRERLHSLLRDTNGMFLNRDSRPSRAYSEPPRLMPTDQATSYLLASDSPVWRNTSDPSA